MPTSAIYGPYIKRKNLAGVITDSTVRSYERLRTSNSTRRVRPRNLLANPTPLLAEMTEITRSVSMYIHPEEGKVTYGPNERQAGIFAIPKAALESSKEEARVRLLEKIKGEDWNLSTFMGELPQTIQYFGKTLKSVVECYLAVKRGRLSDVKRIAKRIAREAGRDPRWYLYQKSGDIANKWLEWRYAISPLMYDLDDMLKYLYAKRNSTYIRRAAGGAKGVHGEIIKSSSSHFLHQGEWQDRCVAYYSVNPNADAFKRLGLINCAATLWELTPLSFVIDWFIPIGRYVGTLDAMMGVSVLSSTHSRHVRLENSRIYWGKNQSHTPSVWKRDTYSRSVGVDLSNKVPRPSISLNSSLFLDSLSLYRKILLS
mgnify:CR=1 FL=1